MLRRGNEVRAFAAGDRLFRRAKLPAPACPHLHKDPPPSVSRHQVDLARGAAIVALDNFIAQACQLSGRQLFSELAQASPLLSHGSHWRGWFPATVKSRCRCARWLTRRSYSLNTSAEVRLRSNCRDDSSAGP